MKKKRKKREEEKKKKIPIIWDAEQAVVFFSPLNMLLWLEIQQTDTPLNY